MLPLLCYSFVVDPFLLVFVSALTIDWFDLKLSMLAVPKILVNKINQSEPQYMVPFVSLTVVINYDYS